MNIFLRKLIYFFAVFIMPCWALAQLPSYEIIPTETFQHEFYSFTGQGVAAWSKHGTILGNAPQSIGNNTYRITYIPAPGYFGRDTIGYYYKQSFYTSVKKEIEIVIIPSRVKANNDFEVLLSGETYTIINVVANDTGSRGFNTLKLDKSIPISNHGTANVLNESAGLVFFRPEAGYTGTASFTYIVCDDIGTCATGVVTIAVEGSNPPPLYEVVQISTTRNTSIPVSFPFMVETISDPTRGNVILQNNVVTYSPDFNYSGQDEFEVTGYHSSNPGQTIHRTVVIDVLYKSAPNEIAFDDFAYTPVNKPVTVNVLANDVSGYAIKSFTQPSNGKVTQDGNTGKFLFEPNTGFTGLTKFTYSVRAASGWQIVETATVFVEVKNQNPATTIFNLSTSKNVPLVINYDVPIGGFDFIVTRDGDHGKVFDFEGPHTYNYRNFSIQGENFIVYQPHIDFVGKDEFELEYCVGNDCVVVKVLVEVVDRGIPEDNICADFDCIWPGDGNNDGIVNMLDLIQLGLNIGTRGLPREDITMDWYGHFGEDWNSPFARSSVDLKYTDSNGDGILTVKDTVSIDECYGLQHNLIPEPTPFLRDLPFFPVPTSNEPVGPGDLVELELHIGTPNNVAYDLYGFNFEILYDAKIIDPHSVEISFDNNSWVSHDSPVLHMVKKPYKGKIEAGYTRTNKITRSGYGRIGKLRFIVDDQIEGFRPDARLSARVNFNSSGMSNGSGQNFVLPSNFIDVPIRLQEVEEFRQDQLKVYPNPTQDLLNVHLNGENEIEDIALYSITGQLVFNSGNLNIKHTSINVSGLQPGMYILEVLTPKGVITQKIQIID